MPLLISHTRKLPPAPTPFTLCAHTTPPTPGPRLPPTLFPVGTTSYPHRCLLCDTSTRLTAQSLILDAYNGLIYDQALRLRMALARRGTAEEGMYDREMVQEGERRITEWRIKRAEEVMGVWDGFLGRWNGGRYGDGEGERVELRLVVDGEGGYVVGGMPK